MGAKKARNSRSYNIITYLLLLPDNIISSKKQHQEMVSTYAEPLFKSRFSAHTMLKLVVLPGLLLALSFYFCQ